MKLETRPRLADAGAKATAWAQFRVDARGAERTLDREALSDPTQLSQAPAPAESSPADSQMHVVETVGAICWLAMDATWMLGWRPVATLLAVPCLVAQLLLFRFTPRTTVAMAVTGSVTGWLGMNITWMLGDLWLLSGLLVAARCLCVTATGLLILAFSRSEWRPHAQARLFAGFRRLRIVLQARPKP
jgi:hypothetical protein